VLVDLTRLIQSLALMTLIKNLGRHKHHAYSHPISSEFLFRRLVDSFPVASGAETTCSVDVIHTNSRVHQRTAHSRLSVQRTGNIACTLDIQ
jgi:hypothetical protein